MDVARINDACVAYRYRPGLGRTVVFANSLGSDQSIWDSVVAALPGGYGVLTYDLRGHGLSTGQADSIDAFADDLSQLIDLLGLKDILFCGVSIGGMIGQVLSGRRRDVVRAAVLCNTALQIGTAERWETRIDAIETKGLAAVAEEIVSTWFGPAYAAQEDCIQMHRAMVSRVNPAGYIAACRAIRDADLSVVAGSIGLPVLCVAGSEDQTVSPDDVAGLAASISGAETLTIDGLGHLPCLEVPDQLAAIIASFDPKSGDVLASGMDIRRAILGDEHVDRAQRTTSTLDAGFQQLITTSAWGQVWASPKISARERSMLTLALLAATGNFEEIPMHIRATTRTGASERDIAEAFQHVAIYAGVPRANRALKIARQVFAERSEHD